MNIWQAEPAVIVAFVEAIIVLLVAFGVPITSDQKVAIIGLTSAVLAVIGGFVVRSQVTPTTKVDQLVLHAISEPAQDVPPPH